MGSESSHLNTSIMTWGSNSEMVATKRYYALGTQEKALRMWPSIFDFLPLIISTTRVEDNPGM